MEKVLNSPQPMTSFTRQLKKGVRYATALSFGGHSELHLVNVRFESTNSKYSANQFQGIVNLLKYAKDTDRVAIIPNLYPLHINTANTEKFSTFYNTSLLYHQVRLPFVHAVDFGPYVPLTLQQEQDLDEMGVVELEEKDDEDELVCWSAGFASTGMPNPVQFDYGLHPSFYPLPPSIEFAFEEFLQYDSLAQFDLNTTEKEAWIESVEKSRVEGQDWKEAPKEGEVEEPKGFALGNQRPKEQVACFDEMFFMGSKRANPNVKRPYDGAGWKEIGQFIRFTDVVERHVDEYLMRLFGVEEVGEIPKYIGMHVVRRNPSQSAPSFTLSSEISRPLSQYYC